MGFNEIITFALQSYYTHFGIFSSSITRKEAVLQLSVNYLFQRFITMGITIIIDKKYISERA